MNTFEIIAVGIVLFSAASGGLMLGNTVRRLDSFPMGQFIGVLWAVGLSMFVAARLDIGLPLIPIAIAAVVISTVVSATIGPSLWQHMKDPLDPLLMFGAMSIVAGGAVIAFMYPLDEQFIILAGVFGLVGLGLIGVAIWKTFTTA